jgi:chemotaxis protein MotB
LAQNAAGFADEVTVESMPNELVISLRDTIPFASGKADLRSRALPVLEKVVAIILRDGALSVAIGGHTDSLRIATPEFPSNWELSTARASRVARYLIEHGVHPTRIAVEGYASFRPRGPNSNALNRSINRRVEIRLFHDNAAPATNALPHP